MTSIRAGVEKSLRLLRTDHLDLAQCHRRLAPEQFHANSAFEEALALKDEGKVRFVGVSAILPTLEDQIDLGVLDAFQVLYSALQRDHDDVIAPAWAAGAGIVIRGGVARGTPDDWTGRWYYMVPNDTLRRYREAAVLEELCEGMSRTAFLIRFTLSNPDLDTTIVGTSSLEHLRKNVATAAQGPLPAEVDAESKRRLDAARASPPRRGRRRDRRGTSGPLGGDQRCDVSNRPLIVRPAWHVLSPRDHNRLIVIPLQRHDWHSDWNHSILPP